MFILNIKNIFKVFKIISKNKKHIKFNIDKTINGKKIGREDKEYGIKLVDIYVDGIQNNTSKLKLNENVDQTELKKLLEDMNDTMHKEGGVGIAAPQIGMNLRVVIFGFEKSNFQSKI